MSFLKHDKLTVQVKEGQNWWEAELLRTGEVSLRLLCRVCRWLRTKEKSVLTY